ncbi:MAG: transcription termination/antitermination protein NusG [Candidatus Omnitrophota bacterium]
MPTKWYVIHTQTGHEEKIKVTIERRAKENALEGNIAQILIPTEKVSEVRGGKKSISYRKFFPGYVLLEVDLSDKLWYLIKTTPGVTGFIGPKEKPQALKDNEVKTILKQAEEKKEKPTPKVIFEKGEGVRVTDGPFTNFNGIVDEVNPNKGKLKVTVSIFGRATPVELEYWQVEKI